MATHLGRFARRGALVVVLLALLLHLAGGWYFAGVVGQDALAVRSYPAPLDLTVVRSGPDSITLRENAGPDAELRSSATFGLEWDGGYGLVSGPARVRDGEVTRAWRPLTSQPAPAQRVSIDNAGVPPDRVPPGERTVSYPSPLGDLSARLNPGDGERADVWAILVHGKGGSIEEMAATARVLATLGLTTLSITYRNDPGTALDPSERYQYGRTEWRDLQAAIEYARSQGARELVLGGSSMGGAIVAAYLRNVEDRSVRAVVMDSPMLDLESTIEFGADQRTLPGTPWAIPGTLVWTAERFASWRYDLDLDAVDYLSPADWVIAPVLVQHGVQDRTVPIATSRALAEEDEAVTLHEERDADHVQSWNYDPAGYERRIREFVSAALR